jgi:hypothetical protein
MPRKPTTPYGYIVFNKSGKVRKHIHQLSDDKLKQEEEVGRQFCDFLRGLCTNSVSYQMLDERDHDVLLTLDDRKVEVQITEISQREYLVPLEKEEYLSGESGFSEFYVGSDGEMYGVNASKRNGMILQRIHDKLSKNYVKPVQSDLWLLIFTSDMLLYPIFVQSGNMVKTSGLLGAERLCASNGCGPFDQVWLMVLGHKPYRIWPTQSGDLCPG